QRIRRRGAVRRGPGRPARVPCQLGRPAVVGARRGCHAGPRAPRRRPPCAPPGRAGRRRAPVAGHGAAHSQRRRDAAALAPVCVVRVLAALPVPGRVVCRRLPRLRHRRWRHLARRRGRRGV
ncbi:hypothetical protein IWQ57_000721, partial [Coemansia nantahalensis]